MGRKRKRQEGSNGDYQPSKKQHTNPFMPSGVSHYETKEEVPWDIYNYWQQRYRIFSKYDDGIWMTDDAWFGVTQESIARCVAIDVAAAIPNGRSIILDAFCGAGGNTIAFALSGKWKRVYAIEKDAATLACAKHNAEIYGVHDKITWFHGDCFEILATDDEKSPNAIDALKQVIGEYGVVFASPPWGGPGYKSQEIFDLGQMVPYTLSHLVQRLSKVTKNVVLYLPRTSDVRQIAEQVEEGEKIQIRHYCTNGSSRALCAYLGDWKTV